MRTATWITTCALGTALAAAACSASTNGTADPGAPPPGTVVHDGDAGSPAPPTTHPPGNGADGGVVDPPPSTGADAGNDAAQPTKDAAPPVETTTRVVAYLPNYSGSYADWAGKIDFTKMTHLNLAFASANDQDGWDMGASDGEVKALVDAAHAAGVKVIASLGGGGGDQSVIARYRDQSHIPALVDHLDAFVARLSLDGADGDIEDPNALGDDYSAFIAAVVAKLRPEGKLVTAAVAQYLQDNMSDATLRSFDFVNVMVYSSYDDGVAAMDYYTNTKKLPATKVVLGAGFFGTDPSGKEYTYSEIMNADGNAWSKDEAWVNGQDVHYTGMTSMKKIADYSKGFGGIMFWELSEDVSGAHSLYKVIQDTM